jgi:D-3-phosphoglycerate dehydrogenase
LADRRFRIVRAGRAGSYVPTAEESEELARANAELVGASCAGEDDVIEAAKDADVVLVAGTRITRRIMEALPKCQAVICGSVGFDAVDVDAATDCGVVVVNLPAREWCVEEVSNHAIALLLACAKKLILLNNWTKEGRWSDSKRAQPPMGSIHGQALGIVGCGDIGGMTARKARCFGLRVSAYDPYIDEALAEERGASLVSLTELLSESDYVSLHVPLNEETRHMIGEKELRQMKPSAYLINTARGPVIDEPALVRALQEGWIAGAGLDVFEREPADAENPLLAMENVVVTPHSASYSDAAFELPRRLVLQEAARVLGGQWPKGVVNKAVRPRVALAGGD